MKITVQSQELGPKRGGKKTDKKAEKKPDKKSGRKSALSMAKKQPRSVQAPSGLGERVPKRGVNIADTATGFEDLTPPDDMEAHGIDLGAEHPVHSTQEVREEAEASSDSQLASRYQGRPPRLEDAALQDFLSDSEDTAQGDAPSEVVRGGDASSEPESGGDVATSQSQGKKPRRAVNLNGKPSKKEDTSSSAIEDDEEVFQEDGKSVKSSKARGMSLKTSKGKSSRAKGSKGKSSKEESDKEAKAKDSKKLSKKASKKVKKELVKAPVYEDDYDDEDFFDEDFDENVVYDYNAGVPGFVGIVIFTCAIGAVASFFLGSFLLW